jgi:cytochrome c oxidase subunit II
MNTKAIILSAAVVVSLLVLAAYSFGAFAPKQDAMPVVSPSPVVSLAPSSSPSPTMDETDSEVQIINVEAGSFYYKPNEIRVKKGQKVKIVMKSVDMMHNFVVDELDINMPITPAGKTAEVEFTADKVGSFEYYCAVGEHRANGQVGTLIVE